MIALKSLSKEYTDASHSLMALDDVSLFIGAGEIFGIIGPPGAGKTTLLRCINGLERPTTGTVQVAGVRLDACGQRALLLLRRQVGMVSQDFNLLHRATVYDNVAFPLRLQGCPQNTVRRAVDKTLEWAGLREHAPCFPSQLTDVQKRRVAVARGVVTEPRVLLFDQAPAGVDCASQNETFNSLRDLQRKTGMTVVLVTSEMSAVQALCDRVAVMGHGRILEKGVVDDVVSNPQHAITYDLVQWAPLTRTACEAPAGL